MLRNYIVKALYTLNVLGYIGDKEMAIKGTRRVTVTLMRTTVKSLRAIKGAEAWDSFLLNLMKARRQGARAECIICRKVLETEDINESAAVLARKNGWTEVTVTGRLNAIGFACNECMKREVKKYEH